MKPNDITYKFGAILLALITPIILILVEGYNISISAYWTTNMQPLFIFTNAVTSYYLFSSPKWRIPSSLLLLLTAFSVEEYQVIHNILAISFFIISWVCILIDKRYRFYAIPYLLSLYWYNGVNDMLITEIIAVYVLCLYHSTELIHFKWLDYKRKTRLK